MKKILALAIATTWASTTALADTTPDNVGDVTYMGNIVANSPMWQWTVNDYPGGRLDAKPSDAVEDNGTYTYALHGQAFIAASGYLPSFVGINDAAASSSYLGTRDVTTLTDQNGNAPGNPRDAQNGAMTFTVTASATDESGAPVDGTLTLKATEVRGYRYATSDHSVTPPTKREKKTTVYGGPMAMVATPGGSCWAGSGSFPSLGDVASGSADTPYSNTISSSAFSSFNTALSMADTTGAAPSYTTLEGYGESGTVGQNAYCSLATFSHHTISPTQTRHYDYASAAHVLELTPVALSFSKPVSGAWNSTLTVTAYQM